MKRKIENANCLENLEKDQVIDIKKEIIKTAGKGTESYKKLKKEI